MKFYEIQIPYRGVIPYLNRRGPIASVELNTEQIKLLADCGVVMLDPRNGHTIDVDDILGTKKEEPVDSVVELAPAVPENLEPEILPINQNAVAQTSEDPEPEEDENPEIDSEPVEPESSPDPDLEQTAEPEETVESEATEPETGDSKDEPDKEEDGKAEPDAAEFDFNRIPDYSKLSKSKKKKLRAKFAELSNSGLPATVIYAQLIELAKSTD